MGRSSCKAGVESEGEKEKVRGRQAGICKAAGSVQAGSLSAESCRQQGKGKNAGKSASMCAAKGEGRQQAWQRA